MTQLITIAMMTARAGCEAALAAEAARMVEPTRREPGCLRYDLCREKGNPAFLAFLETWTSQEALEAHRLTPHLQAWRAASAPLVEVRDVRIMEPLVPAGPASASPLAVIALVDARPGCEAALAQELSSVVVPTRLEPGCLRYDLHRDPANPASLAFLEAWEDGAALKAHMAAPLFLASRDRQKGLVASVAIKLMEPV